MSIAKLVHKEIVCHTVKMLSNSKISQYKIKKSLKYFTEDFTCVETSKLMKLNKKTINRYYNIFREVMLQVIVSRLKMNPESGTYIGYIKSEYGPEFYLNIYKVNKKTFLLSKLLEKPSHKEYAMHDKDFNQYLGFLYKRFSKFHGLTGQAYLYQLFESVLRYNYSEENLFNLIWEQLQVRPQNMVLSPTPLNFLNFYLCNRLYKTGAF